MTTVAVLLARGGSKGIPRKNLCRVGGLSLVARSIIAARKARSVADIYISTDAEEIASEAQAFGARFIRRPKEISGDTASSESGWVHALGEIRKDYPDVERLVFLQCTSPFTTADDIDGCLAAMERSGAACALSVVSDHAFLWRIGEDGFAVGVNHDEKKQRLRRQDRSPTFRESGAIYSVRVADFMRAKNRFCGSVAVHVVDHPPFEIDTQADLEIVRMIAQREAGSGTGESFAARLSGIKGLVMDFDGVHTDDLVHIDAQGMESVTVSRSDGLGISMLRESGRFALLILSKERNPVVARRAEKLRVECVQGCDNKVSALDAWLTGAGLTWNEVLYAGNDVTDLGAMRRAGISVCPCDAQPLLLAEADWICPVMGGHGVIRAIADRLLAKRG